MQCLVFALHGLGHRNVTVGLCSLLEFNSKLYQRGQLLPCMRHELQDKYITTTYNFFFSEMQMKLNEKNVNFRSVNALDFISV